MAKNTTITTITITQGLIAMLAVLMLLVSSAVTADIYKYIDKKTGMLHLTDHPLKAKKYQLMGVIRTAQPRGSRQLALRQKRYKPLIAQIARGYQLEPALLHAIIHTESAYNPSAKSPKGAVGLMQLMPATAKRYGVNDRWDARQNVKGGAKYLKDLLKRFKNLTLALAAYNAGEHAVIRYGNKVPPYKETQNYVKRVNKFYQKYKRIYRS